MDILLLSAGIGTLVLFGMLAMFAKFYHKVQQGHALIINTLRSQPDVTFTGGMVYPIIHKAEYMEISLKTIEIDREGKDGLICRDNIRADIKVTFFIQVNKTAEDVLRVAQAVGCERASHQDTLENLFSAKFAEALKSVGKSMDFIDLYQSREKFRDEIIRQIGDDLSGYVLEDAAIDYLEQTPLDKLDPSNILDSQGIKKITELTAVEHIRTNEVTRDEEMRIKKKDVETREAILELERQQADAESRQNREVSSVRAREQAETMKIQAEEHAKAELARLQAEQQVMVQQENTTREKEVAENNRKRAVAIEEERVIRARQLEIVEREKEVALQVIEKEKVVEIQKKAIADVIRERIVVERTVAEQEEAIKEVRVVAEADRNKKALVIAAEAKGQEKMVLAVTEAEGEERSAKHKAAQELTLADAQLKVAEKAAEAKKREAEGAEAQLAAEGLAEARVKIASSEAILRQGAAQAEASRLQMEAQAKGTQQIGQAQAQVMIAEAEAKAKQGAAEAEALRLKLQAQAQGNEQLGLAEAAVKTADAAAMIKHGDAQAHVIQTRFAAESVGLRQKFEAMSGMSSETRAHEEFRMQLEASNQQIVKGIEAQISVAQDQAELLGKALANAKIDIVGGEGDYFERFVNALALGKGIDGAIEKSKTLQLGLKDHLSGERDMLNDVRSLLAALGGSAGELQNLSMTAFLNKISKEGSAEQKAALQNLLTKFNSGN
ncbi:SPFH domain-containing protein [Massilia sp. W12]|uniref:SPFH domain-containing protein n=1 Tax=Massilia sp. W12 TaxID=3126507 RepID=UPI0030D18F32